MTKKKTNIFIETYGCQMNEYDTELVKSILEKNKYDISKDLQKADVVMINTCSVRENADRKVLNRVHQIRHTRPKNHPVLIGILGCMATNFKTKLLSDHSLNIDFIAGPDSYKELPRLITEAKQRLSDNDQIYDVNLSEFETYEDIYPSRNSGVNAWIAIMRGCNNFCTFCVVPFTRGRERSRSVDSVIKEVKRCASEGIKQITLLGQNVNSYYHDGQSFTDLMDKISSIPNIDRIRFTSPHPKDFPHPLLKLIAERPNICKQIHMPLQAGSNTILKKMNRTYTREEYLELIDLTRKCIPNVAISTDIILGFPTETDKEFEDTIDIIKKVGFDSAYIFNYSERPHTRAAKFFSDDVTPEEKKRRIIRANQIQDAISLKKNRTHIGETHDILIEQTSTKRSNEDCQGRMDNNKLVIIPKKTSYKIGDYITVKITDASKNVLKGQAL